MIKKRKEKSLSSLSQLDTRGQEAARIDDIHLLIELTDFCNQRCIMCKHSYADRMHGSYPNQFLEPELFQKIIDDLKSDTFRVTSIDPLWAGESMLHPQFKEMMRELFSENKKYHFFRGFVLNTNAVLMEKEISDLFLDYAAYAQAQPGFFFKLIFSLDAVRHETYAKIRNVPPSTLARVISNIDYLVRKRNEMKLIFPNLTFVFIVMKENYTEAREFLDYWKQYLGAYSNNHFEALSTWPLAVDRDAIYFRQLICNNPVEAIALHRRVAIKLGLVKKMGEESNGEAQAKEKNNKRVRKVCGALWRTPNIAANGIITPCCRDIELTLEVGDIRRSSLKEIWHGEKITDLRLAHIKGDLKKYPVCLHCIEPEGGILSAEEIEGYLGNIGK